MLIKKKKKNQGDGEIFIKMVVLRCRFWHLTWNRLSLVIVRGCKDEADFTESLESFANPNFNG